MAKIFITGSADGLGLFAAKELIRLKHEVVLHARNEARAKQAMQHAPGAADVFVADLKDMEAVKLLAAKTNEWGTFDAVIHNAGIYNNSSNTSGLSDMLLVNTLAPYILTCTMNTPKRLVYLSSGMHRSGNAGIKNLSNSRVSYSDTKLHNVMLAKIIARKWKNVYANAVDPGWVPTKMGGANAPDSLEKGYATQVWLAVSNEPGALVSGYYFHHKQQANYLHAANDETAQDALIAQCEKLTGVKWKRSKNNCIDLKYAAQTCLPWRSG
ncbi:MAG: SDR family NAD(P)-dependent oxidoreductase [Chitinophagaceae bacterium]